MDFAYLFLLLVLCCIHLSHCSKIFDWKEWNVDMIFDKDTGDIIVQETQTIIFKSGEFTFGYRTIPIGFVGRNDGIHDNSIEVFEVIPQFVPGEEEEEEKGHDDDESIIQYSRERVYSNFIEKFYHNLFHGSASDISQKEKSAGGNYFYTKKLKNGELGIYWYFSKINADQLGSVEKKFLLQYRIKGALQPLEKSKQTEIDQRNGKFYNYQFYWKVIPPDHPAIVKKSVVTFKVPDGKSNVFIPVDEIEKGNAKYEILKNEEGGETVKISKDDTILMNEMLEAKIWFMMDGDYVPEWSKKLRIGDTISFIIIVLTGLSLVIPFWLKIRYYTVRMGKDRLNNIPDVLYGPHFDQSLGIGELGFFILRKSLKVFIANLIDLSIRGYVSIEDSGNDFTFIKNERNEEDREIRENLKDYEKYLLDVLFSYGSSVSLSSLKYKIQPKLNGYFKKIDNNLKRKNFQKYSVNSMLSNSIGFSVMFFIVIFFLGILLRPKTGYYVFFGIPIYFGFFHCICLAISAVLLIIMSNTGFYNVNTPKGEENKVRMKKFKKYMKKILDSKKPDSSLHKEIFDQYLPFSIIFGFEKEWTNKLSPIFKKKPGNHHHHSHSVHYYDDYYYNNWYVYRGYNNSMNPIEASLNTPNARNRNNLFSGETFANRLDRMFMNTKKTFGSVKSRSRGSGGRGSSSRSGGGGSGGFG